MATIKFFLPVLMALTSMMGTGKCQNCGKNMIWNECEGNCQVTCEDVASMQPRMCPMICIHGTGGCVCQNGYALHSGTCVPRKQCPCKEHAEYKEDGVSRRTCDMMARGIFMLRPQNEAAGCYCKAGYALNNTECIPQKEYPCKEHAKYSDCGTACPLTCENYSNPPRVGILPCVMGCVCEDGYVKYGTDGACVLPEQCKGVSTS